MVLGGPSWLVNTMFHEMTAQTFVNKPWILKTSLVWVTNPLYELQQQGIAPSPPALTLEARHFTCQSKVKPELSRWLCNALSTTPAIIHWQTKILFIQNEKQEASHFEKWNTHPFHHNQIHVDLMPNYHHIQDTNLCTIDMIPNWLNSSMLHL